nr:sialate O-acetylesterase [uncultured Aminipila sp.]
MNNSRKTKRFEFILVSLIFTVIFLTGCNQSDASKINQLIKVDDDHYKIEIAEDDSLVIRLPEGRPRVPQLQCEGANIVQAVFSDGYKDAIAKINTEDQYYVVRFTKDSSLGFELQYDDRYKFTPKTIVATKFYSNNPKVAKVDNLGNVKIVGVSDDGAVITATDGKNKEELVITRTVRAPLSIYLITGQSNASYYYAEPELATVTKPGTAYHYSELAGGVEICPMNNEDGTMKRGNLEASLSKTLYDLTGEKVLMVNAGVSGRKMETFVPLGGESYQYISKVWQIIQRYINDEEFLSHYEPRLRSYIWAQGESDNDTDIGVYKSDYMKLHQILTGSDYGFNYGFIIKVRSIYPNSAEAQEELANENQDIAIATRSSDHFTVENGKMRFDDLHYSQIGDNLLGDETAQTIAKAYLEGMDSVTGNY